MNFDKFNQLISLLANLGVVAGIIFLGLEIQQNTNMMRSQSKNAMTENQMSFYALVIENPDVNELLFKGRGTTDTSMYTPEELNKLSYVFNTQLRMWENEWYQYNQGLFEPEEFEARSTIWRREMGTGRYQRFWNSFKDTYSPDFRILIDDLVNELNR